MRINSLLIFTCVGATVWTWQQDPAFVQQNFLFSLNNLLDGRFWTLVTALFVHASVLHLSGNMLFLFVFGRTLERSVGPARHLMVFFIGGITSFLLSLPFLSPSAGMVGASAAIFTVAACVMLVKPLKFSWLFLAPQGLVALMYFLYNVVLAYDPSVIPGYDPNVAYFAHIIGFVTGLPLGISLSDHWKKNLTITMLLLAVYVAILHYFGFARIRFGIL